MGLNKDKFNYDPAEAENQDKVGSYLLSSDGTEITHTTVGGKEALDVNIASPISIATDLDGIYDVGTNATPDSVGSIFHQRAASPDETNQTFRSTGGQPNADDLNPANIHALDTNGFMFGWDGTGWDRLTATGGKLDVTVDDSTPIDVNITGQPIQTKECFGSFAYGATSVANTATDLIGTALSSRCSVIFQNRGNKSVYLGDASVAVGTGLEIPPGGSIELKASDAANLYGITSAGTSDLRYFEQA